MTASAMDHKQLVLLELHGRFTVTSKQIHKKKQPARQQASQPARQPARQAGRQTGRDNQPARQTFDT